MDWKEQITAAIEQMVEEKVGKAIDSRLASINQVIDEKIAAIKTHTSDVVSTSAEKEKQEIAVELVTPTEPLPSGSITIGYWNIAHCESTKQKYHTDADKYAAFRNALLIDGKTPDILGLCEYNENLQSTFAHDYKWARQTDAKYANVCNNVIAHNYYHDTLLKAGGTEGFTFNYYGANFQKVYNYVWQVLEIQGRKVLVIVTHLMPADSAASTDGSDAAKKAIYYYDNARKPQMDSIKQRITDWIKNVSPYVIVVGDFNVSGADKISIAPFVNSKGTTRWLSFGWQDLPLTYLNGKQSIGGVLGENSIPDNIVTSGFEMVDAAIDTDSIQLSDHYALKCKLRFK